MHYEKNCYYHLYNRGCNKAEIFRDVEDFEKLMNIINESDIDKYLELIAYSLKQNHYHFFVKQISDNSVTSWIRYIFNIYAKYYNKKYKRSGTLFETNVKGKLIDKEEYLSLIPHYIHNNPTNKIEQKFCSLSDIENKMILTTDYYEEHYLSFSDYLKSFEDYKISIKSKDDLEKYLYS